MLVRNDQSKAKQGGTVKSVRQSVSPLGQRKTKANKHNLTLEANFSRSSIDQTSNPSSLPPLPSPPNPEAQLRDFSLLHQKFNTYILSTSTHDLTSTPRVLIKAYFQTLKGFAIDRRAVVELELACCTATHPPNGPAALLLLILTMHTLVCPAIVPVQVVPAGIATAKG